MNRSTLHTLAGCGLALALGGILGSHRQSPTAMSQSRIPEPAPTRTFGDTFSKSIRDGAGSKRWLALLSAAEHATAADMPGLVRIAGNDPAMLRMLAARWAELDPKHMLSILYADALLPAGSADRLPGGFTLRDVLLEEWTKRDLAAAIAALNEVPAFSMRDFFRQKLVNSAMQSDVERGLRLMSEWNITNYIPDLDKVAAWAARDPRHAAEVVMPLSGFFGGPALLKEVGKAWAKGDPAEGIQFAAGLAPGARASLGGEIIGRWAERDLAAAVANAEAQPDAIRAALAPGLVATWGKSDPAIALTWSVQNLKGRTRDEAIGNLVAAFAESDLAAAGALVAGMEPGAAQNRATVAVFETWMKKGAGEREAALDWLAGVPDAEARRTAFEKVLWTSIIGDPEAVRDVIAGPHGDMASPNMVRMVASIQAGANPEATMEWANGLPAERRENARIGALEGWLNSRPEGATAFVRTLPTATERTRAIETVSRRLASQSPEHAAKWFSSLPPTEKQIAREAFGRTNLADDKRQQLNKALENP